MTQPHTPQGRTAKRALSVAVAEGIGLAASFGALALVKGTLGQERTERLKEWVSGRIILPFLKKTDAAGIPLDAALHGEEPDGQPDKALQPLPPEERARKIAGNAVDLAVLIPTGFLTRLGVQKTVDDKMGVPNDLSNYVFSRVVDNSVGGIALLGLNTVAKEPARGFNKQLAGVLQKVGLDAEVADSLAKYAIYVQGPNVAGMAANLATLHIADRGKNAGIPPR